MKRPISPLASKVRPRARRMPICHKGRIEREISKEGFFGPAAFFHHRHPPTGWVEFEGPLRPHAFDLNKHAIKQTSPWQAPEILRNAQVRVRYWRASAPMDHLVRNADGDDLLFVHAGTGELYCDYGHLSVATGDYVDDSARHDVAAGCAH